MRHANVSLFVPHMGCPHQCSFCNQKTISGKLKPLTPQEVTETLSGAAGRVIPQNTEIAFFGGSFTAIDRAYMVSLLDAARPFIDNGDFCGIRISTRPDAINEDVLEILKEYNVTSVELGAQSTDEDVLRLNNRGHSRDDIVKASALIKQYGFSLGLQMMTGLLGDTPEKSIKTCEDIISLSPDTVRIYPTITLEGTFLGELYKKGEYIPQSLDDAVSLCAQLLHRFHKAGITVIRLGLHSGGNVEEGYLAGPYHEAFGELCEGAIYRSLLFNELHNLPQGDYIAFVNPREISKMTGQKQINKKFFSQLGYNIIVKPDESLSEYEIILHERA